MQGNEIISRSLKLSFVRKRVFTLNIRKLFLSKWFFYLVIGLVLVCLWFVIIPSFLYLGIIDGDLALNLVSEIWGLIFTLGMFVVLLEYRDWLEGKGIEDRTKVRIGLQLRQLFFYLASNFDMVMITDTKKEGKGNEEERKLDSLVSISFEPSKIKKDLLIKDVKFSYGTFTLSKLTELGKLEERYSKFLGSEVRASIIDIQNYLGELSQELIYGDINEINLEHHLLEFSDLIKKTLMEILKLRKKGYWYITAS